MRIERDVIGRCRHNPVTGLHVWLEYARTGNGRRRAVFCSRCSVRGLFSEAELNRWAQLREARFKEQGIES